MTAPTIEALRREYRKGYDADRNATYAARHDAGLKAVAEMAAASVARGEPVAASDEELGAFYRDHWESVAGPIGAIRGGFELGVARARAERDAARAEAQQARREKNQALHELGATRRDAEKGHEALKAEAKRLREVLVVAMDAFVALANAPMTQGRRARTSRAYVAVREALRGGVGQGGGA